MHLSKAARAAMNCLWGRLGNKETNYISAALHGLINCMQWVLRRDRMCPNLIFLCLCWESVLALHYSSIICGVYISVADLATVHN